MNPVLIITAVVFAIFIIVASIYFLVYFQHPDDKLVAWFPKFVVITGLSISAYNIFLLPLDVAISKGQFYSDESRTFGMVSIIFYLITTVYSLVIVPFAIFWYEGYDVDDSDDPEAKRSTASQIAYTLKYVIPIDIVTGGLFFVLWYFIGVADIPISLYTSTFANANAAVIYGPTYTSQLLFPYISADSTFTTLSTYATSSSFLLIQDLCNAATFGTKCMNSDVVATVGISPIVYIVAVMSLIGWFVFSIFGGIGIITLPMDYINAFLHRPRPIAKELYIERKLILGEQSGILMEVGQQIQQDAKNNRGGKASKGSVKKEKEFRRDVLILEYHYRKLEDAFMNQGGNILVHYAKLIGGIIGAIVSLMWLLHIILYILPVYVLKQPTPLSPFLNSFFTAVEVVPFLGTAFYALFTFYLLLCTVKGVVKLGFRILFITIHPLEIGETLMSSLIFNTGTILISSLAVAQFNTTAFSQYAQFSASNQSIFGVSTEYMRYLSYAFFAFNFLILGIALLTGAYMLFNPYQKQKENRLNFKW